MQKRRMQTVFYISNVRNMDLAFFQNQLSELFAQDNGRKVDHIERSDVKAFRLRIEYS